MRLVVDEGRDARTLLAKKKNQAPHKEVGEAEKKELLHLYDLLLV